MKLYSSLTKRKELFNPLKKGVVAMYNCGPTVYDYVHIGNLRSFLFADILRRYLEWRGYQVKQVINITDVGHMVADVEAGTDKMEAAAQREKKTPWQIAEFYEKAFFRDIDTLNIKRAWKYPRATEHIKEMIKLIKALIKNGHAYIVNGSVYYDLKKFPGWGKLSGNQLKDLIAGKRVKINPEKKNPYDFALWIEDPKHLMKWRAPWSIKAGYPGWHIECSAMAMKYLGKTIDIHTGGEDNKFPHHECEIAQSEGVTGQRFIKYWLHIKHLLVDGKKMSKSLGNFYTLSDLLKRGHSARAVRYALLSVHYRDTLNFTFEGLKAAEAALERIDEFVMKKIPPIIPLSREENPSYPPLIRGGISENSPPDKGELEGVLTGQGIAEIGRSNLSRLIQEARENFIKAMNDDLNVSKALAVIFDFVRKINYLLGKIPLNPPFTKGEEGGFKEALNLLRDFDKVLGLEIGEVKKEAPIPAAIKKMVAEREKARKERNWGRADALRREIEKAGFRVEDISQGPRVGRL